MQLLTVDDARELAELYLAAEWPRRWRHVQAVAARAGELQPVVGEGGELLVVAAWLHDIGYSSRLLDTGFHPVDGARRLQRIGAGFRLCCLVANHSGAAIEAGLRGLHAEQEDFPDEDSLLRDALWTCDMTTSPEGEPVTFAERLTEIRERYGEHHSVAQAITAAAPEIERAIGHVSRHAGAGCDCVQDPVSTELRAGRSGSR
ncbi:HD domain-containing protein [Longispora albida]|uniref:HD domain-containing protein n=1 Tax=Longispora albida TaxID=203523 RepID=UPI0003826794|nr:HD domain-containing protein [Longispora albida]